MKILLLPTTILSLMMAVNCPAQSTLEKAETKIKHAAETTGEAVKDAAKKTGATLEKAGEKTKDTVKSAWDKATQDGKKAEQETKAEADKADHDVTESPLYKKMEAELGRPFTPEERAKYVKALRSAQDKVKDAGEDFAERVSEITGVAESKTKALVKEHGL